MNLKIGVLFLAAMLLLVSCGPKKTPGPKEGTYQGHGKVTKIDKNLGSVELDHDAIEGLMPAMKMEFMVRDKPALDKLAVGDEVRFVLEYKDSRETILTIGP